ncbi:MAG: phosphoribosylformylglycinamidine cyclo-ligase [Acidobacteria bacterium]|nr:phosphoribosylformylglycinamidine cyclo-ligase [Acidobacteriota bacterium]MCK6684724.1 phosphoribosylformylglycinamidine cyclo-ligase [Thermoanaerobaculia bacterium]
MAATKGPVIVEQKPLTYRAAGVDIDTKMSAIGRSRERIRETFTPAVLGDVGGFGGLFRPDFSGMTDPVLVGSTDGVGTKIKVAAEAGIYDTVGQDLVNHCVNDILVQGARPLFFLDYIAMGRLVSEAVEGLISGLATACRENGCALLGGETAEMPGIYAAGDFDLAGTIVGVVDRPLLLDGAGVTPGDVLLGLASSGLHTNGYSLARKVFFERLRLRPDSLVPELGQTVAGALLAVHRSYLAPVLPLVESRSLKAMAHITGGGFRDNIPRVLPADVDAEVWMDSWDRPPLFRVIQEAGQIDDEEMLRVFNCGIGLVLVVGQESAAGVVAALARTGEKAVEIGRITQGTRTVRLKKRG